MTRRVTDPKPGIVAQWSSECPRCGEFIARGVDRIVFVRGNAIHIGCASGASDE
jgi:hypothetical protein